jgi:glutathione S-transferase
MSQYRLYGRRQSGSMAIEAALAEAALPFTLIHTPRPETPEDVAALAAINPRLQVPVLIHPDGTVITEGPAILAHIADASPLAGLAPPPGSSARARHDRWLAFFHANVYEGMSRELRPARYGDDAAAPAILAAASAYVRQHFILFEAELGDGPYLFGAAPCVFDIYLWMICYWADAGWLTATCPRIHRLWTTAQARPCLHRVGQSHFG